MIPRNWRSLVRLAVLEAASPSTVFCLPQTCSSGKSCSSKMVSSSKSVGKKHL